MCLLWLKSYALGPGGGAREPASLRQHRHRPHIRILREFRDVVFEDVVFDNNSSVAPY